MADTNCVNYYHIYSCTFFRIFSLDIYISGRMTRLIVHETVEQEYMFIILTFN